MPERPSLGKRKAAEDIGKLTLASPSQQKKYAGGGRDSEAVAFDFDFEKSRVGGEGGRAKRQRGKAD